MTKVLLDTHVWAWILADSPRITVRAKDAVLAANTVVISSLTLFEISQKVRIGKWSDMEQWVDRLEDQLTLQGSTAVAPSSEIALLAGRMTWSHRDPFDRIIAATAIVTGSILISADSIFDALPLRRIW